MTYKIYLKSDYKPVVRWTPHRPWYRNPRLIIWGITGFLVSLTLSMVMSLVPQSEREEVLSVNLPSEIPVQQAVISGLEYISKAHEQIPVSIPPSTLEAADNNESESLWKRIHVAPGDNMSLIFDRLQLPPTVLYKVMTASQDTNALKYLLPGQELRFRITEGELQSMEYDRDLLTTLQINRVDDTYVTSILETELISNIREAEAQIDSSLFLAGQKAGLSDNLIMQLVAIYGWDIDFALDIRKGDKFKLIYEEKFKDDIKVSEGPILAAEFVNNKTSFKAVRYSLPEGNSDYFSETGASMRKAFIRTPLNFTRISSTFSLNRKHPVLNTIRAHKGVDYAAPSGTPVKAAGDGTITSIGRNGGYGRVIEIRHGGTYSTLYAHLSNYAKGLKKGSRVKQGQTVGYVGMSGLATGPHLHYEFRVNGVHRNPLTVQLPKADSIPDDLLVDFKDKSAPLLAQLEDLNRKKSILVALKDKDELERVFIPKKL